MIMRRFAVGAVLASPAFAAAGKDDRHNILFLMTDSMDGRVLDVESTEHEAVEMPFLRGWLAEHGTNFVHAYSNSPMCVPSRTSMMTGRSNDKIEVWGNRQGLAASPDGVLDDNCVKNNGKELCQQWAEAQGYPETIFSALKNLGYRVHMEGRLHIGAAMLNQEKHNGTVEGLASCDAFDTVRLGEITRSADIRMPIRAQTSVFTTRAIEDMADDTNFGLADWGAVHRCKNWIEQLPSPGEATQPFFLHCSLNLPHFTYATNSTWLQSVHEDKITIPTWKDDHDKTMDPDKWHPYDSFTTLMKGVDIKFSLEEIKKLRRIYYGMCAESDAMLSQIWDGLYRKGYNLANTYVIYVSDHGEMKFEHRQVYKSSMYEGSVRVPFQIAGPGVSRGKRMDKHLTSLLDVFPTLLDMAGEKNWASHTNLMGRSVLAAAGGASVAPSQFQLLPDDDRDFVFSQYNWVEANTGATMVRQGKWKLVTFGKTYKAYKDYPDQLFDLEEDPEELDNVAAHNGHVVKALHARLLDVIDPDEVDKRVVQSDFRYLKERLGSFDENTVDETRKMVMSALPGLKDTEWLKFRSWLVEAQGLFGEADLAVALPMAGNSSASSNLISIARHLRGSSDMDDM